MRTKFERQLAAVSGTVSTGLAIVGVIAALWFAGLAAKWAVYSVIGWSYPYVSIGDYLDLAEPHAKFRSWDRSFLLPAIAFVALVVAGLVDEAATWLRKSPEQRREARAAARRAVEEQRSEERTAKETRKAARKPMSGWRRLWIVASVLAGIPAYLIAYDAYSRASATIAFNGDSEQFWDSARDEKALGNCDWSTAETTGGYPSGHHWVSCENADPWLFAIPWAFFPGLLLALIGLTIRWIYRGFRPIRQEAQDRV